MSLNETKPELKASDEDLLYNMVRNLRDEYGIDLEAETKGETPRHDYENIHGMYPNFAKTVKNQAEQVKDLPSGYKTLLAVPSFALGLVMIMRIFRHYRRASWFKVGVLNDMLENNGAVSKY